MVCACRKRHAHIVFKFMKTKFLYTRSYIFKSVGERVLFFELIERFGDKLFFKLRDKWYSAKIEASLQSEDEIEKCIFEYKGMEVSLVADKYISKGFKEPYRMGDEELREWKQTSEDALKDAHLYSSHHREEILSVKECGCFNCQRIFLTENIKEWVDNISTAICPFCGTDAVVPNVKRIVKVSPKLLKALNEKYF